MQFLGTPLRSLKLSRWSTLALLLVAAPVAVAAPPPSEPVVARMEMRLVIGEDVENVIHKGDLLTVLEEREDDYVIVTHDGVRGAVDKVNAVRIAESGDIYTELIEEFPEEGRYYTLRASSWLALDQPDKALADFDKAIDMGYQEAHAFSSRGLFHASKGDYEKAIADYNEALKIDPESPAPLINRAAARMGQRKFELAIDDYSEALARVGDRPSQVRSLLRQRAIAYKAAGQFDKAVEDYETLLADDPADFSALMGRGFIHFRTGDQQAAIEDFSKAIELRPEEPVAWNNRGFNRFQIGLHAEALADYDEAIRLQPKYALALQNRAWLLATTDQQDLRDPQAAIKSAREACKLTNYENVTDLAVLAAALAAAGEFDEAVGWQEKVVAMTAEGEQENARKTLTRYQQEKPYDVE